MRDYTELVKALRHCIITIPCNGCPYYSNGNKPSKECSTMNFAAADAIEELLDELTTIRKQFPRWISVEDELPPKYHQVLCYGANGILVDYYSGETSVLGRPLFMVSEARVSHWMPLPTPPKGVE